MTYEIELFDGHMAAGNTVIVADDLSDAIQKAAAWANDGGDWHTDGTVVCWITDSDGERTRHDIDVFATAEVSR